MGICESRDSAWDRRHLAGKTNASHCSHDPLPAGCPRSQGQSFASLRTIALIAATLLSAGVITTTTTNAASLPLLRVSDNHRYLVTADGQPFFWLGDTAWELFHRLDREEAEHYLRTRAAQGYNVVLDDALENYPAPGACRGGLKEISRLLNDAGSPPCRGAPCVRPRSRTTESVRIQKRRSNEGARKVRPCKI